MYTKPRPIYYDKCSTQVPVERYRPKRVCVGADTRTLKIKISRCTPFDTQESSDTLAVTLSIEGNPEVMQSYALRDGVAYFNMNNPTLFKKRGIYRTLIGINGCCIGVIEVNYAPPFHVMDVEPVNSKCAESNWEEPDCMDYEQPDSCVPSKCNPCPTEPCGVEPVCKPNIDIEY